MRRDGEGEVKYPVKQLARKEIHRQLSLSLFIVSA